MRLFFGACYGATDDQDLQVDEREPSHIFVYIPHGGRVVCEYPDGSYRPLQRIADFIDGGRIYDIVIAPDHYSQNVPEKAYEEWTFLVEYPLRPEARGNHLAHLHLRRRPNSSLYHVLITLKMGDKFCMAASPEYIPYPRPNSKPSPTAWERLMGDGT